MIDAEFQREEAQEPSSLTLLADALQPSSDPPWAEIYPSDVNRPAPRSPGAHGFSKVLQRLDTHPLPFPSSRPVELPELPVSLCKKPPVLAAERGIMVPVPSLKKGLPKWAIYAVVVTVVLLAIASTVQKLMFGSHAPVVSSREFVPPPGASLVRHPVPQTQPAPATAPNQDAKAESKPEIKLAPPLVAPISQHAPPVDNSIPEHPYGRFVEVTTLRVIEQGGRPQVQYSVENHSSVAITDLGLHIEVRRPGTASTAPPLFTLAARVPNLAAHQSKEIRTDLDTKLRMAQFPVGESLNVVTKIVTEQ